MRRSVNAIVLARKTATISLASKDTFSIDVRQKEYEMAGGDEKGNVEFEAAAFRRLVSHLRQRTDVQNIDMMTLAGFCRNCLADWYREAANEKGLALSKDESRAIIYGMPYKEWQSLHQKEATPAQRAAFQKSSGNGH
jgi:hypothetical protein